MQPQRRTRTIAVDAPYGQGGVGQHVAQLIEATRRDGQLRRYYKIGRAHV